ncbi:MULTISPECIES: lactate racemase domain-containing protein [unclassified Actinotalea]|uniref:lactate racemase domain-containing protein n=1 Tax=unclassified Actinotalea TaxID=2638618 RepID=UPI0015F3ADDD|nr:MULTISPECIES: lactate racemase domain-containing protein [unclassified Actinotalea]
MKVDLEYGHGTMTAELPDDTDVFVPGETVADPAFLPDPIGATRAALRAPLGLPPIGEQAGPGSRVVIVFPDRVKGGEHATSHRRVAIRLVLDELEAAGVAPGDILLLCSNGLHAKNTEAELRGILGPDLYAEFSGGRLVNHDSEDEANLVDLGRTAQGDPVIVNRAVFEADVVVMIGHTLGNPYGGYSGAYKHIATGITHWRCIAAHHVPKVMHRPDFTPVSHRSLMRSKFEQIGRHIEERMGRRLFCVDAVLDTRARQIAVHAGDAESVQRASWPVADRRTFVPFAEQKYDVMVFGLPQSFHYGDGMGTNPLMIMQAISAQVVRHKRVLADNCVIIASSICDGWFHDELFTGYRAIYDMFQTNGNQQLPDVNAYAELLATDAELIRRYRFGYGFHPFHGFSMISSGHIAEMNTSAVYLVGAREPGYARGMGMKTRATFEEALADAKRKYVGPQPRVLALPRAFRTAAVHLCLKDGPEALAQASRHDVPTTDTRGPAS